MIANLPGSVGRERFGARVLENERPRSFAANVNRGVAETTGDFVLVSNPDAYPEPGAVAELVRFAEHHPRAASSARSSSGPTAPGSRPAPLSDRARDDLAANAAAFAPRSLPPPGLPLRDPAVGAGAGRLVARRRLSPDAPDDARRARRLGCRLPPLRRGHRRRLPRRPGRLGALARPGGGRPPRLRRGDRQALPRPAHALASARDGPLPAQASRAAARPA